VLRDRFLETAPSGKGVFPLNEEIREILALANDERIADAIQIIGTTESAVQHIIDSSYSDAIASLEEAIGKAAVMTTARPDLSFFPLDVEITTRDLVTDMEVLKQVRKDARHLTDKGYLQAAHAPSPHRGYGGHPLHRHTPGAALGPGASIMQSFLAPRPITGQPFVDRAAADPQLLGHFPDAHGFLQNSFYNQGSTMKRGSGIVVMVVHWDLQGKDCDSFNHQSLPKEPCEQHLVQNGKKKLLRY